MTAREGILFFVQSFVQSFAQSRFGAAALIILWEFESIPLPAVKLATACNSFKFGSTLGLTPWTYGRRERPVESVRPFPINIRGWAQPSSFPPPLVLEGRTLPVTVLPPLRDGRFQGRVTGVGWY